MFGLYVHIPFCVSLCPYCSFSSIVLKDRGLPDRYLDALERELDGRIEETGQDIVLHTLYLGGGTPTTLTERQFERLFSMIGKRFFIAEGAEITVEANPATVDAERFAALQALGVRRLSLGVQSFTDRELRQLGRAHTADEAKRVYEQARQTGFENISIDLIFALPGQTVEMWEATLDEAIALAPEHISTYGLTIEEGTPFERSHKHGKLLLPDDDSYAALYGLAVDRLTEAGYEHYETSNFALPGFRARHNANYWDLSCEYLGVGASAHSYLKIEAGSRKQEAGIQQSDFLPLEVVRFWNVYETKDYITRMEHKGIAEEGREILTPEHYLEEAVMLGLRKVSDGLDLMKIAQIFGGGTADRLVKRAEEFVGAGYLEWRDERTIRLTRRGLPVTDEVCVELLQDRREAKSTKAGERRWDISIRNSRDPRDWHIFTG